jgi:hypothetical protein
VREESPPIPASALGCIPAPAGAGGYAADHAHEQVVGSEEAEGNVGAGDIFPHREIGEAEGTAAEDEGHPRR